MARPLDQIADWADIHGVTPDAISALSQIIISSPFYTYHIPDQLFREQFYIDQMKFRKPYITKLHALLTERLPGSRIAIKLSKINNGIRAHSAADGEAQYAAMLAGLTPAQREAEGRKLTDVGKIEIMIKFPGAEYWFSKVSITNPSREDYQWSEMPNGYKNKKVGLPVNDIVFNTILEIRNDAAAKVLPLILESYYRPPGTRGAENAGGIGYLKTAAATSYRPAVAGAPAGGSRKRRRRHQTHRQRKGH